METSVKDILREEIDRLTDDEAREMLEYTKKIRANNEKAEIVKCLSNDPAIKIPADIYKPFSKVEAVKGKGIPASELLIRERR